MKKWLHLVSMNGEMVRYNRKQVMKMEPSITCLSNISRRSEKEEK